MPPEIPPIEATPLGALLGHMAGGIVTDVLNNMFGTPIRGGTTWARWQIGKKLDASNWVTAAFDAIGDGEAHPVSGLSPAGIMYAIYENIESTVKMMMIMEGEIVEELFMELIQEGMSNAVQYSLGGAYQTIMDVYRGAYPPMPDMISTIMENYELFDMNLLTLLVAMAGANIPTTAYETMVGLRRHHETDLQHLRRYLITKIDDKDTAYYHALTQRLQIANQCVESQCEKEWMVRRRANDMIAEAARRYLARLNELMDELEAVKHWFDAGLISEGDASLIAVAMRVEAGVIDEYYSDVKSEIESKRDEIISDMTVDYTPVIETQAVFDSFVETVCGVYEGKKKELVFEEDNIFKEMLQRLRAYRYYSEITTPPTTPVIDTEIEYIIVVAVGLGRMVLGTSKLGGAS